MEQELGNQRTLNFYLKQYVHLSQAEDFKYLQQKSDFLGSAMGKGVILLSLSMIKYSWYVVMKTNYEEGLYRDKGILMDKTIEETQVE